MNLAPVETFESLERTGIVRHAFLGRVPGLDVETDRETALARLAGCHAEAVQQLGLAGRRLVTAAQIHSDGVEAVAADSESPVHGADGLVTDDRSVVLGIYVADCGVIYLVDPVKRAIGLIHSGKKGTELNIAARAIAKMGEVCGTEPSDLVMALGPCIRPPHYEVDFAADIIRQCREAGVESVNDCGTCTASVPERYYSYRREKGRTGRMLALLALV
jgi:hypothetical protein